MAHRRAVRGRAGRAWLLVPVALTLDMVTALALAGRPLPMGLVVPQAVLLVVPFLLYGGIAFLVLRSWPLASRFVAAGVLLGLHASLVALHTVAYIALWSLPAPAALRLAHRWSPLVPLLQLVWVPLLALPLVTLTARRPRPAPPRRVPTRVPVEVLLARASHAGPHRRTPSDHDVRVEPHGPATPSVTPAEVTAVAPAFEASSSPPDAKIPVVVEPVAAENDAPSPPSTEPGESLAIPPAQTFDEYLTPSAQSRVPTPPVAEPVGDAAIRPDRGADPAPEPVTERPEHEARPGLAEPVASRDQAVNCVALALIPPVGVSVESATSGDLKCSPAATVPMAATGQDRPVAEIDAPAAEPPLDLDLVARAFAPYGPLLSRDREIEVNWAPDEEVPVVCVVPRGMSRARVVRLAARLVPVLAAASAPLMPGRITRLSLQSSDGVMVLTPLDGAVLAAAALRRGAIALLEVLSARVVPDASPRLPGVPPPDDTLSAVEVTSPRVRVETPVAMVDVIAPAVIEAVPLGELFGRLLTALAADAGGPVVLDSLSVDFGTWRLVARPVQPLTAPPCFVALVGGVERPGLLGRRAERAARALRAVS